ncbi:MAG: aminotransferase class I/II-fold pyridoxal phosphate-dependent enzyme [Sediminibacterium sp.]|nr:aminotransferase class I/II-fold pyridoxal phosphate-dependent enzyme [Sediminibacterium sp.]
MLITPSIHSRLPMVGTTIFTVMSQLAKEYDAINLGQGFPDCPRSEELIGLVNRAMQDGHNQYTHMNRYPLLRERLAAKVEELYQYPINPEQQITITPGGTYAIYTALTAVLQPGDEVIVFEPAYDSYIPNITINGGVPVLIPLSFPDYRIPWDEVRKKISARTRVIMLNTPHNPTGMIWQESDMLALAALVEGTQIIVLSDEVYEHLIYDDATHQSVLRFPSLRERSFVCFSFGKTYHCTGWKLGYCIAPETMMHEFRKVHQFNSFSCDTPKQVALAEYLLNKNAYIQLGKQVQQKRDYFCRLMQQTPFEYIPSHGSYFACFRYGHLSQLPDREMAIRLTKDLGVATVPVSVFYQQQTDHKVLRFCFAKKESTLDEAVSRLQKFQSDQ